MLLNLTSSFNVKARDHPHGGLQCFSDLGPSFGVMEFSTKEPLLGEGNVISCLSRDGFMIGGEHGSFNKGDIHPLTNDTLIDKYALKSKSTAKEIEVW